MASPAASPAASGVLPGTEEPPPADTVLYLCYGLGPHVDETRYSLLSALGLAPPGAGLRYVVYTDHPLLFADLPVVVREIAPGELVDWMGGLDYVHRRKSAVIADALGRFPGSVAFVDCDTYYLRSPQALFARIGPGAACLHLREARLLESGTAVDRAMSALVAENRFSDTAGRPYEVSPDAVMWNSGVVGLHSADAALMEEVLHLVDQMWVALKRSDVERRYACDIHHIEQFATGLVLERLRLREADDIVFHYWLKNLRNPFRVRLPALLQGETRFGGRLEAARPRGTAAARLKQGLRKLGRSAGIRMPGIRAST